jgi:hypothetical protein
MIHNTSMNWLYIQAGLLIPLIVILHIARRRRYAVQQETERRNTEERLNGHAFDATEINARMRSVRSDASVYSRPISKRMAQERFATTVRRQLKQLGFFRDADREKE